MPGARDSGGEPMKTDDDAIKPWQSTEGPVFETVDAVPIVWSWMPAYEIFVRLLRLTRKTDALNALLSKGGEIDANDILDLVITVGESDEFKGIISDVLRISYPTIKTNEINPEQATTLLIKTLRRNFRFILPLLATTIKEGKGFACSMKPASGVQSAV